MVAPVAQWIERGPSKPQVVGSSPTRGTGGDMWLVVCLIVGYLGLWGLWVSMKKDSETLFAVSLIILVAFTILLIVGVVQIFDIVPSTDVKYSSEPSVRSELLDALPSGTQTETFDNGMLMVTIDPDSASHSEYLRFDNKYEYWVEDFYTPLNKAYSRSVSGWYGVFIKDRPKINYIEVVTKGWK